MRRRKRLSFPDAQCPKILLNSSISRSSRNEPKGLNTNTQFLAPLGHEGEMFLRIQDQKCQKSCNVRYPNAKMPPTNAKQEFKAFYFKDTLKEITSFFKTKATQTIFFLLK
jgi:hypothetical protein